MRGVIVVMVLALAGCNEHAGWNPNYLASAGPYGQYRVTREAALTGEAEAPATIPVARPFYAPTAQQIAGGPAAVPATPAAVATTRP
jgi:hypothetical protein